MRRILLLALPLISLSCSSLAPDCETVVLEEQTKGSLHVRTSHRACGGATGYLIEIFEEGQAPTGTVDDPSSVLSVLCECSDPKVNPYQIEITPKGLVRIVLKEDSGIPMESFGLFKSRGHMGSWKIEYVPAIRVTDP